MKSSPSSVSGFTLTELLLVVAIVAILASFALPSFKSLTQSQQVKNASFELYASLSLTRSEAIKRNCDVTITPQNYSVSFPTPTHNEVGWVIASSASCTTAATIRNQAQLKGIALTPSPPAGTPWVTYQRTGRATAPFTPILIDAYGATTPYASCIKIELSGMPRIYKPVSGAC